MEKSHKNALLRYFDNQDLIIIVSGEHFYQGQKSNFFKELERYVFNGGALLATSWISWINNTYKYALIDMLPFKHQNSNRNGTDFFLFKEDKIINCKLTKDGLKRNLLTNQFSYETSYELLIKKYDSITNKERNAFCNSKFYADNQKFIIRISK